MIGRDVLAFDKDKQEVLNYLSALEYLNQLKISKHPELENQDILDLHAIITKGVLKNLRHEGRYRRGREYVLCFFCARL